MLALQKCLKVTFYFFYSTFSIFENENAKFVPPTSTSENMRFSQNSKYPKKVSSKCFFCKFIVKYCFYPRNLPIKYIFVQNKQQNVM